MITPNEEFKSLYLIKNGEVNLFDRVYNYLQTLENRSFFGEYNIMFGLYSTAYY